MRARASVGIAAVVVVLGMASGSVPARAASGGLAIAPEPKGEAAGGYVVERDADVAAPAPGPHAGLGRTTGYLFFEKIPDLPFAFRKRVLHSGSSIGYHRQTGDEVYYVVSGTGRMTIDGRSFDVRPGDAILTRPGSSHGLNQTGPTDLSIMIVYATPAP